MEVQDSRIRRFWLLPTAVVLGTMVAVSGSTGVVWRPLIVLIGASATFVAIRRNNLPKPFAAMVMVAALRLAFVGVGGDGFVAHEMTWVQAIGDALVCAAVVSVLLYLLRARRGALGRRELLDGLAVAVGAGLVSWITLANPAIGDGVHPLLAVLATSYFPTAIMLVTFAADFLFDGLGRNRAMWLAVAASVTNLAGSLLRALMQGDVVSAQAEHVLAAIFVVGFVTLCAAITEVDAPAVLTRSERPVEASLAAHREAALMAPMIISLAIPIVLVAIIAPTSDSDIVVRTIGTLILVAAVVARLYVALDANATAQQTLVRRLNRDELTNLLTRPRFVQRVAEVLDATWRSEHHATLIQINIDRFKNINDTLGHDHANRLLVAISERLSTAADSFGGTLARSGGDDFVIVDGSTKSHDDVEARVERITGVFSRPFNVGDESIFVTASVGVAQAPRNRTVTGEELMRRADIATHRAKADGRNRVIVFDDSMQSNLTYRMAVEHALHGAIGRQEMRLYYQPIVDIVTGQLSGFEALIRWKRSDGTILPPSDFIPIAEETGIINELGAWALNEGLSELKRWIDDGTVPPTATMSVNVSPRQIADPNFADIVRAALDRSGVSQHLLWLEMTESMMLEEPELAQSTLRRIRAMGVRLALDDFGTGYSSLSLLQQFPIQRIKIDRAFVQGIADHSNDRSLVRTIIAMAQSMGLDLVAEGVETVHQLQSLRDLSCDKAQGYLISRPVPADAMRSTMVALGELADLSLFAPNDGSHAGVDTTDRWLEPAGATGMPTLGRHLATRPMG
jgi:diguanylate cyclase (GGDEF)-like protein